MRSRRNPLIWIVTVVGMLFLFGVVQAKWFPYVEGDEDWGDPSSPWQMSDATGFSALYGRLDAPDDVDSMIYTFDAPIENWTVQAQVPLCGDHFAAFYPSVAVLGPGLPGLPFVSTGDDGVVILTEYSDDSTRAENSQMGVYEFTEFTVDIPEAGDYVVVVWEPHGNSGAYTLVTGSAEPNFAGREQEAEEAFEQLESGDWMGQDCDG
jgi:hypothetical protein